jgi:superfamily II DNA or RNA helicase
MGWSDKLIVARMINNVCNFAPRNHFIVETIVAILKKEPDRQLLILSERRNHLVELDTILKQYKYTSIGFYTGGMKQADLDASATKQILLGTFQLAQEGMDVPTLNTLILASPVSSIEQAIGRIQRQQKHSRKYHPLVVDIIDEFSIFERQGMKRLAYYKKNKYEVIDSVMKNDTVKYTFVTDPDEVF